MSEIISESSVAEAKTGGDAPMDADELRLAQMGMSLRLQVVMFTD
jgi:hypothetical protein